MGFAIVAERKEQEFQLHRLTALRRCRDAGDHRMSAIKHRENQRHGVAPLIVGPKIKKRVALLLREPKRV